MLVKKIQHVNLKVLITCPGTPSVDDTQAETSDSRGFLKMLNCSFKREADRQTVWGGETDVREVVDLFRLIKKV